MTDLSTIRKDRHLGIGSSDAKRIIDNDWRSLYLEKTQQVESENLDHIFRVQLGIFTEQFHIDWLSKREGWASERVDKRNHHKAHKFMYCHLDGWVKGDSTFVEVKHSNSRATARDKATYYMPQLQHTMAIMDVPWCHFSVIAGNDEPELVRVDAHLEYQTKLIEMEQSFWWHVENKVEPEITPTAKQEKLRVVAKDVFIDGLKEYDMTGNNEWAALAVDYIENEAAVARFNAAKDTLKDLVPQDASVVSGYGLMIKKDKRGAKRFSVTGES